MPVALPPAIICFAMLAGSTVTYSLGAPHFGEILLPYLKFAAQASVTALIIFLLARAIRLARAGEEQPLAAIIAELRQKLPYLLLPLVIAPLFLAAYTASKIGIAEIVGFRFDRLFADIDRAIFTVDPWRLTHWLFGPASTAVIQFLYTNVWIAVLGYSMAMVALFSSPRKVGVFYTAMFLTWFVGGFAAAYILSSAGPTFAHFIADPEMASRFAPLKQHLLATLDPASPFISGPAYLESGLSGTANAGGGISAMPSMHIGACAIWVLAARGTRWFVPACLLAVAVFIGSVHSGYHYAIDAPVAALIAWLSWQVAERCYPPVDK